MGVGEVNLEEGLVMLVSYFCNLLQFSTTEVRWVLLIERTTKSQNVMNCNDLQLDDHESCCLDA